MIRMLLLAIAAALPLVSSALADESKPSKAPVSAEACRADCDAQYNQDKSCHGDPAPMHTPCEMFNLCVNGCK